MKETIEEQIAKLERQPKKRESHKEKMERKRKQRDLMYRSTGESLILANISAQHMDYGMSPAEHLRAKQERAENNS
jgi:DNA-binding protein H-NS